MTTTTIGLDPQKSQKLAEKLNILLANYSIFYMNVRGFHWNIKGENFFELHLKFEELYTDLLLKIDEVAERIVTLGFTPLHSYADFQKASILAAITNVSDGKVAMRHILEGFEIVIKLQRELLQISSESEDEATNSLMGDYIRLQEKTVWMYSAYLG